MEIKEIEKKLKAIKWFTAFSIYCSKDMYEIRVYRNRRATIQSGLSDSMDEVIKRAIEKANEHDERVGMRARIR